MKKVASLRYEVIFKKAFTNIDIFKAFVKDFTGAELDIDMVETEKRFDTPIGRVDSRFDLFAQDKQNRTIVDIQHVRFPDHCDRFLHYHCAAIMEQVRSAEKYEPNLRVFTIVVLTSGDKHKTDIAQIDFDPKNLAGEPLNEIQHKILYLCPKYVTDQTPEPYREWLRAINDSLDTEVDETAYQRPEIKKIFELIEEDQTSPEELFRIIDENGYEELWREKFGKLVRGMLSEGIDMATVMKITELPEDIVQQLAEDKDHDL